MRFKLLRGARAALLHLLGSILIAAAIAVLVYGVWYPHPYRELVGGTELFLLVMAVDIVCGPLLTAVLYNPEKSKKDLIIDISLVVFIQLFALAYGIYAVVQSRPVYAVFEVDRIRVITAADLNDTDWDKVKAPWNKLPWFGPQLITVREPVDNKERVESIGLAISGKDIALRPAWWKKWDDQTARFAIERAKPITELRKRLSPDKANRLDLAIARSGVPPERLLSLPMTSFKTTEWIALIDNQTARPLAYAPIDGF